MFTIRLLGSIGLTGSDGTDVDALLRQPKRIAVLAYLAMPRPGIWHRRDTLLLMFWPDLDQARARASLRSALYALRQHLPENAIRTRGDEEVSLDPEQINTDVAQMSDAISAEQYDAALDCYGGDFLTAHYIHDSPLFERWTEHERARLKGTAMKAALTRVRLLDEAGDHATAAEIARRATDLEPNDEAAARQLIVQLDRTGDRAQALMAYERLRDHLLSEFGSTPSRETVALAEDLRSRIATVQPGVTNGTTLPQPATPVTLAREEAPPRRRTVRMRAAAAVAAILLTAIAASLFQGKRDTIAEEPQKLVVLAMENNTGRDSLAYIATGLADGVARRLGGIGGLTVRSAAWSQWPQTVKGDVKAISRAFGSAVLLRTSLTSVGDSLELSAALVWPDSAAEKTLASRRFVLSQLRDVESTLAASITGGLFRAAIAVASRLPERDVKHESYRLMLEAWYALERNAPAAAVRNLFQKAVDDDPSNARAWAGLATAWAVLAVNAQVPFETAFDRSEGAARYALSLDPRQGSALSALAFIRAVKQNKLSVGIDLIDQAKAAEPGNAQVHLVASALYRHAWLWDESRDEIRMARQLDPLTPFYLEREATVEICAGRPEAALRLLREELKASPYDGGARFGMVRALAMLGSYDEAIAAWRPHALEDGDTVLINALRDARGARGYWEARHVQGRARLAKIRSDTSSRWKSPLFEVQALMHAGELESGFVLLEKLAETKDFTLFRLPCMPDFDEVRTTERFRKIAAHVGGLQRD